MMPGRAACQLSRPPRHPARRDGRDQRETGVQLCKSANLVLASCRSARSDGVFSLAPNSIATFRQSSFTTAGRRSARFSIDSAWAINMLAIGYMKYGGPEVLEMYDL